MRNRFRGELALGAVIIGAMLVWGLIGPLTSATDPSAQDLYHTLQPPSWSHPFGTDAFGRDTWTRLMYGMRLALGEIALCVGLSAGIGVPVGLVAGYVGGMTDRIVMGCLDLLFAFPGLVLALLIISLLGPGLGNAILAIAAFSIPVYGRLARNLTLSLRHMEYIEALRVLGASRTRIVFVHILRNALAPLMVQATLSGGTVVLTAASLSFLGLGAQPPSPEWGAIMSDGRNYLGATIWPSLFPGLAIALTVIGLNCLGNGLNAARKHAHDA